MVTVIVKRPVKSTVLLLICILMLPMFVGIFNIGSAKYYATLTDWWPMFRHDSTHSGYSTSTAPTTNQPLWNFTTGAGVGSSPAVAGGVVFVGSDDDNVYALAASDGSFVWIYTTGDIVWSSPAVADGVVFVGSFDNNVYALNATNGDLIWSYTKGASVGSSPAVADGVVYVGAYDGNVYAFATPTYDVTFVESGLASGTAWAVTFNGVIHMTTLGSISFTVPNGVYAYSVKVPSGYSSSSTLSGNLIVADESVTKNIIFTQDEYATVGGELSQTGYIESFLVPTLVMLGISGAICMLGFAHIKRSKQTQSKPHNA